MRVEVQCYSGRKADEKPVRFRLGGHDYVVEEVVDAWYGPEHVFFKVRADDGNLYILRPETSVPDTRWELVSLRDSGEGGGETCGVISGRLVRILATPGRYLPVLPHFR